jgi:hypothetical protein
VIRLASWCEIVKEGTVLKTVLVMAAITIIAGIATIAISELLTRRHPQAGPPPRRRAF